MNLDRTLRTIPMYVKHIWITCKACRREGPYRVSDASWRNYLTNENEYRRCYNCQYTGERQWAQCTQQGDLL